MNIIDLFSVCNSLSTITRYSQTHLLKDESVLEHIGFVALFCLLMKDELQFEGDLGQLLGKALVHDLDEVITGDVARPTKYFNQDSINMFRQIEVVGIEQLVDKFDIDKEIFDLWDESKKGESGRIVKIADLISVAYKIWMEVIVLNNHSMIPHAIKLKTYLSEYEHQVVDQVREILDFAISKNHEFINKVETLNGN